jgi:hypothetical protein
VARDSDADLKVADGMLFVSSGYSSFGFMPGNALLAFSVE